MEIIHFSKLIMAKAKKRANSQVLFYKDYVMSKWVGITWKELADKVQDTANSLINLGVEEHDNIGICTQNMPQSVFVDYANFAIRAVSVPMYATSSASQLEYIVNDAEIKVLFVGEQQQYDEVLKFLPTNKHIKHIIAFDPSVDLRGETKGMLYDTFLKLEGDNKAEIKKRQDAATREDLAMIMYTSGTTGESKGVMLDHNAFLCQMETHTRKLPTLTKKDISIAFLPMTHVFERTWIYFCLHTEMKVYINLRPTEIQQTIKEVRPTVMCSVPRFWEKVGAGIQEKISQMSPSKKALVTWALAVGKEYNVEYKDKDKKAPISLALSYAIAHKLVFGTLKKTLGIDRGSIFPTAGAAMDDKLCLYFRSMGIPIFYGYGLTESTATVSFFPYKNYKLGSIGTIIEGLEVKISDDNEILLKGPSITKGYYKKPQITAEAFTEDGFFKTGDAGKIDEEGNLYITERIKDLFKTSNGKYIAPQQTETKLGADKYIEQIAVIGNNRNYVTAIIVPSIEIVKSYAEANNISYNKIDDLLENERIIELFEERIKEGQADMASYEKIKKFKLIKKGFSMEAGELTATLKLRRAVILQNYGHLIEEMYEATPQQPLM